MRSFLASLAVLCWTSVVAAASCKPENESYTPGPALTDVSISCFGPNSICYSGNVHVSVNVTTTEFKLSPDLSQAEVTNALQRINTVNSTFVQDQTTGSKNITARFRIAVDLCMPRASKHETKTVQVLSHGLGLSKEYWNTSLPDNSYIATMNAAGYSILAYDRLGVGASQKPDPISIVQFATHIEVLHGLVQLLRAGSISSYRFTHFVGVGHSVGSLMQLGDATKYPKDFDVAVITGYSDTLDYLGDTGFATTPALAKHVKPEEYGDLPGGYVIGPTSIGFQLSFFYYPHYSHEVFQRAYANSAIYSVGELLTIGDFFVPASSFVGPVYVIDGLEDITFCLGNCSNPHDRAAAFRRSFFPAASSKSATYLVPNVGHLINDHDSAMFAFDRIISFLKKAIK